MVDGCFWHGCPIHGTWPQTNSEWWRSKIERTIERDRETTARLSEAGWMVLRVWEHEDPVEAAAKIAAAVTARKPARRPT
jgi:DNA mismatch endonuclease (patch repair protein)